jgi:hypothetical protein
VVGGFLTYYANYILTLVLPRGFGLDGHCFDLLRPTYVLESGVIADHFRRIVHMQFIRDTDIIAASLQLIASSIFALHGVRNNEPFAICEYLHARIPRESFRGSISCICIETGGEAF